MESYTANHSRRRCQNLRKMLRYCSWTESHPIEGQWPSSTWQRKQCNKFLYSQFLELFSFSFNKWNWLIYWSYMWLGKSGYNFKNHVLRGTGKLLDGMHQFKRDWIRATYLVFMFAFISHIIVNKLEGMLEYVHCRQTQRPVVVSPNSNGVVFRFWNI